MVGSVTSRRIAIARVAHGSLWSGEAWRTGQAVFAAFSVSSVLAVASGTLWACEVSVGEWVSRVHLVS